MNKKLTNTLVVHFPSQLTTIFFLCGLAMSMLMSVSLTVPMPAVVVFVPSSLPPSSSPYHHQVLVGALRGQVVP